MLRENDSEEAALSDSLENLASKVRSAFEGQRLVSVDLEVLPACLLTISTPARPSPAEPCPRSL